MPRSRSRSRRSGFTLIELLIVIVILGILVALLVPAVMRAVSTANNATVSSELQAISQALAAFKTAYGTYPPSRCIIAEDGDYSSANLGAADTRLVQRSTQALRRIWPRMKILTDGSKPPISGGWYDVNGDGKLNKPYMLQGHECLTIFLGGVPQATDTGFAMMGFSKDPTNPFQGATPPPSAGAWPYSTNRTNPFMEFAPGRLKPTVNLTLQTGAGPLPGYVDRFGGFICYFSSYMGTGYDPDDINFEEQDENGTVSNVMGAFQTGNAATPPVPPKVTGRPDLIPSNAPNPYLSDKPVPATSAGALDATDKRPKAYFNPQSFQLISAGRDLKFGIGGQWIEDATDPLPTYPAAVEAVTSQPLPVNVRRVENDNIANFAGGTLD